jgi:glutathione S-transferase
MKLIASLTSPYVRKIRIVLAEKKIDCDLILDSPWEQGNKVATLNPLGKVPVLVLDDDSTLYDSRVIAEYLDAVAPNNRLIPASGKGENQRQALGGPWPTAFLTLPWRRFSKRGARMASAVHPGLNGSVARSPWHCRRCRKNWGSSPGAMAPA